MVGFEQRKPSRAELFDLTQQVEQWVGRLHRIHGLRGWEPEDLVQEVMLRAMIKLEKFEGRNGSSLKTWVLNLARNHLIGISRSVARRPSYTTSDGNLPHRPTSDDPPRRMLLRVTTKELLSWLRANPDGVKYGWEVLNLLLKTHGNYDYTAFAMTMHTGFPWTAQRVRAVRAKFSKTPPGQAMCQALGIVKDEE